MKIPFPRRRRLAFSAAAVLVLLAGLAFWYAKNHKTEFAVGSLNLFQKVAELLPLSPDTKKEIEVVDKLVAALTKKDGVTRTYLVLLQNNYELRPGGGFLGQYAVVKVKDGAVVSEFVEDANLLDQRITAKVTPPYPFARKMQIKNWKFRDSNFSPDFPTNVEKAEYFYRLAGGHEKFDGVVAINAEVLNHTLELTGPVTPTGYSTTFRPEDAALTLEEVVEKNYLGENVPAEAKQNRKAIMKRLASDLIDRLTTLNNVPKVSELVLRELREKNVMLSFTDPELQGLVESVHWDGRVNQDWSKDYLMLVDANMGALKTDFHIKRALDYTVDFTGDKPLATLVYTYQNNAPYGDWRTSDYHTYLRAYVPKGSTYLDRFMINSVLTNEEFGKTYFGGFVDVEIGQKDVTTTLKYELPESIKPEDYELLIQKQSGVGTIPVAVHLITKEGKIDQTADLASELHLTLQKKEDDQK
jgi:hypothetical protein